MVNVAERRVHEIVDALASALPASLISSMSRLPSTAGGGELVGEGRRRFVAGEVLAQSGRRHVALEQHR